MNNRYSFMRRLKSSERQYIADVWLSNLSIAIWRKFFCLAALLLIYYQPGANIRSGHFSFTDSSRAREEQTQ